MRLIFLGPPGAGKGTQARLLCDRYRLRHISTGEELRAAIRNDSDIGSKAKHYIEQGNLVPDSVVWELARTILEEEDSEDFILDGYPRTVRQAEWLDSYLERVGKPVQAVISFEIDPEVVVQRLSQRRIHAVTGENYHLEYKPPPGEIAEDDLVQRDDDKPEAVRHRLKVYEQQTRPVKAHYDRLGVLSCIDGIGSVEEVSARIEAVLGRTA